MYQVSIAYYILKHRGKSRICKANFLRLRIKLFTIRLQNIEKRTDEPNWIHINTHSIGCSSRIGMKGGQQVIRAGGCLGNDGSFGKLAHEIMHSLGK